MAEIRPALPGEAATIVGLLHALAIELGEARKFRSTEAAVLAHGFGPNRLFRTLLAIEAEIAAGVVVYFPTFSTTRGAPGVYVQDLYVDPGARHAGLGRRLLGAAIRDAQAAWDARYLMLMVYDANTRARAFYAREGFGLGDKERPAMLDGRAFGRLGEVR
jgi:ribosomal protein S18 acetylase RimI-like enzyme